MKTLEHFLLTDVLKVLSYIFILITLSDTNPQIETPNRYNEQRRYFYIIQN